MTKPSKSQSDSQVRVNQIIAAYLEAVGSGRAPSREELLARNPDLADELRAFLADHDEVNPLAAPLRESVSPQTPTVTPEEGRPSPHPGGPREAVSARGTRFGDYELQGEIARGGMGVVYRARQLSVNRPVALKMILAGRLASPDDVQRFHREAEAAANLDHPNIVPIYEVGEHNGQHFFSMKLIEGGSLAQHLGRHREDPRGAARLVASVARAVHHAHQRGILHRDLKPGNILLDAPGVPHVTDFGLAKKIEADAALTQSGAIVGTPEYMAPEQARAQKGLTTAADVYSLGAVLYALLAGRPPFQGDNVLETLRQVIDTEPASLRDCHPRVERDLETVCFKCLDKDPARRYASAEALAEDLECWLNGEPVSARPAGGIERLWRWGRRNPVLAGLGASVIGLALAVMAVLAGATVWITRDRDEIAGQRDNLDEAWKTARQREEEAKTSAAEAVKSSTKAEEARKQEARERARAEKHADESRQRLGLFGVLNGLGSQNGSDPWQAPLWFAQAYEWDHDKPERAEMNRQRLRAFLHAAPRLLQLWHRHQPLEDLAAIPPAPTPRPNEPAATTSQFSGDSRFLLLTDGSGASLWDRQTGNTTVCQEDGKPLPTCGAATTRVAGKSSLPSWSVSAREPSPRSSVPCWRSPSLPPAPPTRRSCLRWRRNCGRMASSPGWTSSASRAQPSTGPAGSRRRRRGLPRS
jgi:hypothetical protein